MTHGGLAVLLVWKLYVDKCKATGYTRLDEDTELLSQGPEKAL
jgi:hypothetical protein